MILPLFMNFASRCMRPFTFLMPSMDTGVGWLPPRPAIGHCGRWPVLQRTAVAHDRPIMAICGAAAQLDGQHGAQHAGARGVGGAGGEGEQAAARSQVFPRPSLVSLVFSPDSWHYRPTRRRAVALPSAGMRRMAAGERRSSGRGASAARAGVPGVPRPLGDAIAAIPAPDRSISYRSESAACILGVAA